MEYKDIDLTKFILLDQISSYLPITGGTIANEINKRFNTKTRSNWAYIKKEKVEEAKLELNYLTTGLVTHNEIVKGSTRMHQAEFDGVAGIYFLLRNTKIVYIGQSSNMTARLDMHLDKRFNRVFMIKCEEELLKDLEMLYTFRYLSDNKKAMNAVNKRVVKGLLLNDCVLDVDIIIAEEEKPNEYTSHSKKKEFMIYPPKIDYHDYDFYDMV